MSVTVEAQIAPVTSLILEPSLLLKRHMTTQSTRAVVMSRLCRYLLGIRSIIDALQTFHANMINSALLLKCSYAEQLSRTRLENQDRATCMTGGSSTTCPSCVCVHVRLFTPK